MRDIRAASSASFGKPVLFIEGRAAFASPTRTRCSPPGGRITDLTAITLFGGHIAAGGGDQLIQAIAGVLSRIEEPYAATALPAAWLWTRYAGFRLATVYLSTLPSAGLKKELVFREEAQRSQHLAGCAQRRGRIRRS